MVLLQNCHQKEYLNCVSVIGRIFKEAVVWVEDLSGQQEEEFPGGSTIVQPLLTPEGHVELGLGQLFLAGRHDLVKCIF